MNNKYNEISFCTEDYREHNKNEYEMFNDITDFVRIAIQNGYQMKIWFDGMTVCIEYNYQDTSMSGVSLCWLDEDEYIAKENNNNDEDY